MRPCWANLGLKSAHRERLGPQVGANMGQVGGKRGPRWPKMGKDAAKMANISEKGAKMRQRRPTWRQKAALEVNLVDGNARNAPDAPDAPTARRRGGPWEAKKAGKIWQ